MEKAAQVAGAYGKESQAQGQAHPHLLPIVNRYREGRFHPPAFQAGSDGQVATPLQRAGPQWKSLGISGAQEKGVAQ